MGVQVGRGAHHRGLLHVRHALQETHDFVGIAPWVPGLARPHVPWPSEPQA